ncbi:MAG: chemotaxis-specific protein-glutamate methyltransferase CheB [Spirochaetaceae bacterium]|jgi:two-component system chemotaxis response regulator CheB|nr:chemotaxis-specific protein-glutamate methyltransferase CheB [Spirochaetaceae bacterium]
MTTVLVVDDDPRARRVLKNFFEGHEGFTVIGEAENGAEGVQQAQSLNPDLITMDIEMPGMSGLEAISIIMRDIPTPIVVISAQDSAGTIYEATLRGALEFYPKAIFTSPMDPERRSHIYATLKRISAVQRKKSPPINPARPSPRAIEYRPIRAVVIGASTGGPKALMEVFAEIPKDFPAPIITVQHNSSGFDKGFVQWIQRYTALEVLLAEHEALRRSGRIYIAPTDKHLILTRQYLCLDDGEPVLNQKPAVDLLFQSAAEVLGREVISVVLTGMGRDGATGTKAIRKAGGITIAQDEASSLIYGMPKSAIETGCVDIILPLGAIAKWLIALTMPSGGAIGYGRGNPYVCERTAVR